MRMACETAPRNEDVLKRSPTAANGTPPYDNGHNIETTLQTRPRCLSGVPVFLSPPLSLCAVCAAARGRLPAHARLFK